MPQMTVIRLQADIKHLMQIIFQIIIFLILLRKPERQLYPLMCIVMVNLESGTEMAPDGIRKI